MRIIFMGTPDFAVPTLKALALAGHDVAACFTQPPRPAGRGKQLQPSPVQREAEALGIAVRHPVSLKVAAEQAEFAAFGADIAVVAAYGLILPQAVLDAPRQGCLNVHGSLLPRWRGAAPIQRAILAGDRETGISIMRMEQGLDTGPVYLVRTIPILPDDSAGSLHDRVAGLGGRCIVEALPQIAKGALAPVPQASDGITYAPKITKLEAAINWQGDSLEVNRQVRAFNPFPGAFSRLRNEPVKIWRGLPSASGQGAPGEILGSGPDGIDVACGKGILKLTELQKAGGRRLTAAEFLRGWSPVPGERFGS
jgi:methionyl-tRNA formyltransferase